MKVFVFGGGGDIGEYVLKRLSAEGHEAVTIAETENRAEELKMVGASKVMITTRNDFVDALAGCEALIYVSGANPAAGENMNVLVDHDAVARAMDEAHRQGIERIVYLSPVRADESQESKKTGGKQMPEELIMRNDFVYTVVKPSRTVSKPGTGMVNAGSSIHVSEGEIPYEDVAAVLVESLSNEDAFNKAFELSSGDTPIKEALQKV